MDREDERQAYDHYISDEELISKTNKGVNKMKEVEAALRILVLNYRNGNNWISNLDIKDGYEFVTRENGIEKIHVNLSRRISDINIRLSDGSKFYVLKDNYHNGTKYTAYKLPILLEEDMEILFKYTEGNRTNVYKEDKPVEEKNLFKRIINCLHW